MQDEKISRLTLPERVKVLREIKNDLEREYGDLCKLIDYNLQDHRNNLTLIEKVMKSSKIKIKLSDELADYRYHIAPYRISANSHAEIFPRVLSYSHSVDPNRPEEERLQSEEDALVEKIYEYRKRNVDLRARLDATTEMVGAMNPLYNAIADSHLNRGLLLNMALRRYEKERERISSERTNRKEYMKDRDAGIMKDRNERKEKLEFDRRRQKKKEEGKAGIQQEVRQVRETAEKVTTGKGLEDNDDDEK